MWERLRDEGYWPFAGRHSSTHSPSCAGNRAGGLHAVRTTPTGVWAMRHTDDILATRTTTRVVLTLNSYGQGSVSLIAEEAGGRNIHGSIAKVDGDMNG